MGRADAACGCTFGALRISGRVVRILMAINAEIHGEMGAKANRRGQRKFANSGVDCWDASRRRSESWEVSRVGGHTTASHEVEGC